MIKRRGFPACPDTLDEMQLRQLDRDGFITFEGLLSEAEVDDCRNALTDLVTRMHRLYLEKSPDIVVSNKQGAGHSFSGVFVNMADRPFGIQFEKGVDPAGLEPDEAALNIRKLMHYRSEHRVLDELVGNAKISGILESILGPGSQLFQDMALVKNPHIGVAKPWHQDNAYFSYAPLEEIIGVWIALDDSTVENGCMHFIPGAHNEGALKHYHDTDCEIEPGRIDPNRIIPVEIAAGGVIFFYGMAPHYTPPNRSDLRRRALQYHYRGSNTRQLDLDDYDRLFAESDGTPATCRAAAAK
jgi:phytanoyl-CoA hydroxylase